MDDKERDNARSVFQVLIQDAASGYSVMKQTGLTADDLVGALKTLMKFSLVVVKGNLSPDSVGEAYLASDPSRMANAEILLR